MGLQKDSQVDTGYLCHMQVVHNVTTLGKRFVVGIVALGGKNC